MNNKAKGTLVVRLLEGILTRDTELIGKMDPFVEMEVNGQVQHSSTDENGGKTPHWNDVLCFRC